MKVSLNTIREWLDAKVLSCEDRLDIEVETVLACDLMSDLLAHPKTGALLITGLTNSQVVHTLVIADMVAAVIARGKLPDKHVIELAEENGIVLLATKNSVFQVCGQLHDGGLKGVPPEEHFVHVVRTPV